MSVTTAVNEVKTQAELATEILKKAILDGDLPPGEKLHIHDLSARYELGVTPVREGLCRLASLGLVVALGQRGFRTAVASQEDFQDTLTMRTLIETEALKLSLRRGGKAWEAGVQAALKSMESYCHLAPGMISKEDDGFDHLHKQFHMSLISACGSDRMLRYCSELYDQAYRYRRIFMSQPIGRFEFLEEHRELALHVLGRDEGRASAFLTLHLASPFLQIYGPGKPDPICAG
jgi:GntR family carbon starvation induced transcriptional regulator